MVEEVEGGEEKKKKNKKEKIKKIGKHGTNLAVSARFPRISVKYLSPWYFYRKNLNTSEANKTWQSTRGI